VAEPVTRLASCEIDSVLADEPGLLRRAQEGDRQAFAVLVERYWNPLYRWLYHLSHDRHTAEDLAQDALLKAFAAIASFKPGTNFRAWLFRIAYNRFVNLHHVQVRRKQVFPDDLPASGQQPIDEILSRETMQLLARTLGRLPSHFRAAFLLRAEQGLSFREISRIMETTEETARWRVFKARQKLMEALAPYLGQETS
jgi:RNA polymerase sigma-70 factor (ECF subfamily)